MRQVFSPLLEEAALGCRLLPTAAAAAAATAAAAAADGDSGGGAPPLCVPRAVRVWGALTRLRTPEIHGVRLASSVDAGKRKLALTVSTPCSPGVCESHACDTEADADAPVASQAGGARTRCRWRRRQKRAPAS